jgi:hypothetical protein
MGRNDILNRKTGVAKTMKNAILASLLLGVIVFSTLTALGVFGGRSPTEADRDNRRLLDALLTAITLKNARLLEDNAKRLDQRQADGHLSEEEYEGMRVLIQKARAGDWTGAEMDGYAFRKKYPFVKEGQ